VLDDDLAGHLDQERLELTGELSQRKQLAFGFVVPRGRTRVAVDETVPLDDQPGEFGAADCGPMRGAFQERRRGGASKEVGESWSAATHAPISELGMHQRASAACLARSARRD
jgi:hypothetical protein